MRFSRLITGMIAGSLLAASAGAQSLQDIVDGTAEADQTMPVTDGLNIEEPNRPPSGESAILRGVDKITARVSDMMIELDEPVSFGTLEIVMRYCYKRPPEETPEVYAFLEIIDQQPNAEPQEMFAGWMFSSSPALSALEHPVYDVWVIDCIAVAPDMDEGKANQSP